MTHKNIENAYRDIMKSIIEEDNKLNEENFWPIYNGIILCYKKNKMKSEIKDNYNIFQYKDMVENQLKSLQNLMLSLPYYKDFFEEQSYDNNLIEYLKLCDDNLFINDNNNYENIIKNALNFVVDYMVKTPNCIRNIEEDIDKQLFIKEIEDFQENKKIVTPQFVEIVKAQKGENGVSDLQKHMKELALYAINSQISYYKKVANNICNFYAKIEKVNNMNIEIE